MLVHRHRPNTQYGDSKLSHAETNKRVEALKKKNFKRGDLVVVGGNITAVFVRGDLKTGDAYVSINGREQKANPTNLEWSSKTK